jgi:hypothetical protein
LNHSSRLVRSALSLLALLLAAPGSAPAQTGYKIKPILKAGDAAGDVVIPASYYLWLGGFSDRGEVIVDAFHPTRPQGEILLQVADGKSTVIARPAGDGPGGAWPKDLSIINFASNAGGTTLLNAVSAGGGWLGQYRWEARSGQLAQVLKPGMPAVEGWTIEGSGNGLAVNGRGETAVVLKVRDSSGKTGFGIFLIGQDSRWQPVLLPGQELPGGGKLHDEALHPLSLSDGGAVAFLARREGDRQYSAFLWDQGKTSPILAVGADAPGGKKIGSVSGVWPSSAGREVIVTAGLGSSGDQGIYRIVEGALIPIAVSGQELPGVGRFGGVPYAITPDNTYVATTMGAPNEKGQQAFLAAVDGSSGSSSALYVLSPGGGLSLVARSGDVTELGKIQLRPQRGTIPAPFLNNNGEIAVVLSIDNGPSRIAVLAPASP